MKFLNDPQLQALTNCLTNREIGDVLLEGRTELYSLKSGHAEKKFARELEALIATEAAHRRERSASFSLSSSSRAPTNTTTTTTTAPTTVTNTITIENTTNTSLTATSSGRSNTTVSGLTVPTNTPVLSSLPPTTMVNNTSSSSSSSISLGGGRLPNDSPSYTDDDEYNDSRNDLSLPTSPLLASSAWNRHPQQPQQNNTSVPLTTTDGNTNTTTTSSLSSSGTSLLSPRTLFILINTLNNSYPDYDFTDLRSHNFLHITDINHVRTIVNTSLSELAIEENRYPTLPQEMEAMVRARQVSTQQIALASNSSSSTNATVTNSTGGNHAHTSTVMVSSVPSNNDSISTTTKRKRGRPSGTTDPVNVTVPSSSSSSSSSSASSSTSHGTGTHHSSSILVPHTTSIHAKSGTVPWSSLRPPSSSNTGTFFLDTYWSLINSKIQFSDCEIYSLLPDLDSDPLSEDAIWSFNFFFLNRSLNRIVYIACVAKSTAYTSTTGTRNNVVSPLRRIQASPDNDTATGTTITNVPKGTGKTILTSHTGITESRVKKTSAVEKDDDDDSNDNDDDDEHYHHTTPEKRTLSRFPIHDDDAITERTSVVTDGNGGGDDQSSYISSITGPGSSSTTTNHRSLSLHTRKVKHGKFTYLHPQHHHSLPYQRTNDHHSEMYAGGIQGALYDDQDEDNDVSDDLEYMDDEDYKPDIDTGTNQDDDDDDDDHEEDEEFNDNSVHYKTYPSSLPSPNIINVSNKGMSKKLKKLQQPHTSDSVTTDNNKHITVITEIPNTVGSDGTDHTTMKEQKVQSSRQVLYSPLRAVAKSRSTAI